MKIWLDLTNSPHVKFFAPMIAELKVHHELVITCRPLLTNTIGLLDIHGLERLAKGQQAYELILDVLPRRPIAVAAMRR